MAGFFAELLRTQAHVAAGRILLWMALGLAAGILAAWSFQKLAGRGGAWELDAPGAGVVRALSAIWIYTWFGVLGMSLGFAEGSLRGLDVIVRESQFRHHVLEPAAQYASLGVAWMDLYLAGRETKPPMPEAERERRWQVFGRGETELDALEMVARLERSQESAVKEASEAARERLRALEGYGGGLVGRLVEMGLGLVTHRYTRGAAAWLLSREGADVAGFFTQLPAAAAAAGSPRGISHAELSRHIVERTLVPNIMGPARLFVRAHQALIAAFIPAGPLPPMLLLWLARRLRRWRHDRDAASARAQHALEPPGRDEA